jgi:hypothetical protein
MTINNDGDGAFSIFHQFNRLNKAKIGLNIAKQIMFAHIFISVFLLFTDESLGRKNV